MRALTLVCLLLFTSELHGEDLAACRTITSDSERLKCYDKGSSTDDAPKTGQWQRNEETSNIDDSKKLIFILTAENSKGPSPPSFVVRCDGKELSTYFYFNNTMSDEEKNILFRVDKKPAEAISVDVSTNKEGLGFWSSEAALKFLEKIKGAQNLYIRALPFNEGPVELAFSLAGFDDIYEAATKACER